MPTPLPRKFILVVPLKVLLILCPVQVSLADRGRHGPLGEIQKAFVSYILFEVPSNMVIARVRPSIYLCSLAFLWGVIAALMALTQNWKQLAGVRLVLGFVESGFAPGIAFYLSSW